MFRKHFIYIFHSPPKILLTFFNMATEIIMWVFYSENEHFRVPDIAQLKPGMLVVVDFAKAVWS